VVHRGQSAFHRAQLAILPEGFGLRLGLYIVNVHDLSVKHSSSGHGFTIHRSAYVCTPWNMTIVRCVIENVALDSMNDCIVCADQTGGVLSNGLKYRL
jgi:hypothetical protein